MDQYIADALEFWQNSVNRYYSEVNPNNPPRVKGNTLKLIFAGEEDQEFRTDYGRIEAEGRGIILYDGKNPVQGISWEKLSTLLDKKNNTMPVPQAAAAIEPVSNIQPAAVTPHMSSNAQYAYNVHAQIVLGAQMVENGLYQMAKGFKIMRDDKLYKELGYKSFEEYCEKGTCMTKQHVYRYIKIIEKIPDGKIRNIDVTNLGSTKLQLLASLTEEQREELTSANGGSPLESITVKELKAQIEHMNGIHNDDVKEIVKFKNMVEAEHEKVIQLEEQVKELNNLDITDTAEYRSLNEKLEQYADKCTANEAEIAARKQRVRELEAQIKELESRPIEVQGLDENSRAKLEFEIKYKAAYEYVNLAGIAAAKAGNRTECRKKLTELKTMIDRFLK